jgi:hypothetical protein
MKIVATTSRRRRGVREKNDQQQEKRVLIGSGCFQEMKESEGIGWVGFFLSIFFDFRDG